jgi:O-methyltransferase
MARMFGQFKALLKAGLATVGYEISSVGGLKPPSAQPLADVDGWVQEIAAKVAPYTMTSPDRVAALCLAIEYVSRRKVSGDIVECGVWKGGSSMAAAWSLLRNNDTSRTLHLFDTFEGMPPPTELDRHHDGKPAAEILAAHDRNSNYWAYSPLNEVKTNLGLTGYPTEKIRFIQGKVEGTIPAASPEKIAVLRLDTDWYESTKHELEHLYPLLSDGGVLIIDDYGYWQGARRAVDEYFTDRQPILLNRIDQEGRIAVKT